MKAFYPKFQVILHQVFRGGNDYDITEWFGEGSSIQTGKSYREPSGAFSLTLNDKIYPGCDMSPYALISPMDAIEIRAAHNGTHDLKLLMRGFVSNIQRSETIGNDGTPSRTVTIVGQDVGKLMLIHWIHFLQNSEELGYSLAALGVLLKYFGDKAKPFTANEFVNNFAKKLDEHLKLILASTRLKGLSISADTNIAGTPTPYLSNGLTEKSYYQFLAENLDIGSFNEMFMEDNEDGAKLIVRPVYTGEDSEVTITEEDIQSINVSRNDAHVANWYWVQLQASSDDQVLAQMEVMRHEEKCDAREDMWCRSSIYGLRKMSVGMALYPPNFSNEDNPTKEALEKREMGIDEWLGDRINNLRENNYRNAHLESGSINMCGNENVKVGTWIPVQKSDATFRYYIANVSHNLQPYVSFTTTLQVERGEEISGVNYKPELNLKGVLK